jgi:hypothetical protein
MALVRAVRLLCMLACVSQLAALRLLLADTVEGDASPALSGEHEAVVVRDEQRAAANASAPSYHLVTYATPSHLAAATRLLISAKRLGGFSHGKVYGPGDLDELYRARNAAILAAPRGAGYWIFKPYVILHYLLHSSSPGDYVCYMDSMYEFKADFRPWINDWTLAPPHIGLPLNKPTEQLWLEKDWSKRDAFLLLGVNETETRETNQAWCGFIAFKHTDVAFRFVAEWLTYTQDARIVTDSPSTLLPETPDFKENRHDQTVCSLLSKKWGVVMRAFPPDPVHNHHLG